MITSRRVFPLALLALAASVLLVGCAAPAGRGAGGSGAADRAEAYFRAVYAGDPARLDELAAEDVEATYPIFAELFGTPVIRGRDELRAFAEGFGQRWRDPDVTIHERFVDGDRVVLVWTFEATWSPPDETESAARRSWGGLTLIHLDADGRVVLETGEESSPGPIGRLTAGD